MLKNVQKYGFRIIVSTFCLVPMAIYGQDLGSSRGIFRPSNPPTASTSTTVKKTTPKPSVSKPTPPKKEATKTVSKSSNSSKKTKNSSKPQVASNKIVKQTIPAPPQINTIITPGKPTKVYTESYEQAIDEGNNARDDRSYVKAENAYMRAKSLRPDESRAFYGLGNIYSDQQRWEEAEKAYRQAIQLEPNSPEAHIAISFVLTQPLTNGNLTDRYVEAEKMARKAIQLDPNNAFAYDQLGVALELRGMIGKETQSAYRKAIELDSNFALAYAHLGRLLRRNGLTNESSAAYRDAVRLAGDVPTMILVADVMQSQQRYTESEQLLRRALRDDPKNPTALFLLGRALTTRGSYDEAEKVLKKSVDVSPNSFVSYVLLSSLYTRRNNFDDAEKILIKAISVVSTTEKKRLSQEFEMIGDAMLKAGMNKDAVRVYQRALNLDGDRAILTGKLNKAQKI